MAVSAGMITVTLFEDFKNTKVKKDVQWVVFGFALMWMIVSLVPHVHVHDDIQHTEHNHLE